MPLISVIVPCYNQAQFLDECLQSVQNQTYTDWECIIVNDGSPDHTEEIAKNWTEKDSRFIYLYKENGGLSSARNAGIEIAKGEWILPLDADDKIGNQYLDLAEKEFANNYTVIYCEAEFFGNQDQYWDLSDYSFQKLLFTNLVFCSAFFKKSDWKIVNGYDINLKNGREDWDFWLSILNPKKEVKKINYLGFKYRRKDFSMDHLINLDQKKLIEAENYIYKKHLEKYLDENKNAIKNHRIIKQKIESYDYLLKTINKNKLTKFLYKIIKKLQ